MNVKEVNNSTAQFLLGKNAVSQQGGEGSLQAQVFANLIVGVVATPENLVSSEAKVFDSRPSAAIDKEASFKNFEKFQEKDVSKNARPERDVERPEKREDKSLKESKKKDKTVPDAAAIEDVKQENVSSSQTRDRVSIERGDAVVKEGANEVALQQEGVQSVSQNLNGVLSEFAKTPFVASVSGQEVVLMSQNMDLGALAQLPEVNVFDASSGQVLTMTGADLALKIQQASANKTLFAINPQAVEENVILIPAEVSETVENRFVGVNINAEPLVADSEAMPIINEKLAEQARVLDAEFGGRKAKVEVDIKEDGVSFDNAETLLQDKVLVDEVVDAALKGKSKGSESQNTASNSVLNASSLQNGVASSINNQNMINTATPIMPGTEVQVSAEAAKSATVEGGVVHHSTNSTMALNGAVASQSLKAELSAKAEDTTFRDIYKGMSREAVEQVKVNITKSAVKGVDKIDIQLKPEDLGHVQIKMQISKDGKLQAEIIASRQDTLNILQKEADSLQKAFNEAGFDTDSGSFSFSFRGEEEQQHNAELRNFIGNVLEQEANEEFVSNDNLNWDPSQGLNIRV